MMNRLAIPMVPMLVALLCMCMPQRVRAQSEPEYLMEIGAGVSMNSYIGDFNASPLKKMQPGAEVVFRRLLNPRQGFCLELGYGNLKGSSMDSETYYPDYNTSLLEPSGAETYEFKSTLVDLNATYEYNFWPYGTGREYRGAKRLVPYVAIGLGLTYAHTDVDAFTVNIPIGFGVKYKIADRLNLGVAWKMHLSMSDKLDGVADPYYIKSGGICKNADGYSRLAVSLTYSFKEKCRVCHNSDE